MGNESQCTKSSNVLLNKLKEQKYQEGFTPYIFPREQDCISNQYLSTQYPNNKPTNQHGDNIGNKRKGNDPKSENKDSYAVGTAGTCVEDTTTNEDNTAPSRGASLGPNVSKTNQAFSSQSCTVDEFLGAHPVDDDFLDNTNPTDVSIDTMNSEEKILGSHITKFHTHEDKQLLMADQIKTTITHMINNS